MTEYAIKLNNITKSYNMYAKPSDRFREALNPFKKSYHDVFYAWKNLCFARIRFRIQSRIFWLWKYLFKWNGLRLFSWWDRRDGWWYHWICRYRWPYLSASKNILKWDVRTFSFCGCYQCQSRYFDRGWSISCWWLGVPIEVYGKIYWNQKFR